MCELMFPKPTKKKKRKHHPAPIVDTVKGECFLCRLEGIRRQQYTEEFGKILPGTVFKVLGYPGSRRLDDFSFRSGSCQWSDRDPGRV